jgi:ABC-2 type transport system permease protein
VLYQLMMHLSGLFYPLPGFLRAMAPVWPSYHLQQLVFHLVGLPSQGPAWSHVAALSGLTVLITMVSVRRLARVG